MNKLSLRTKLLMLAASFVVGFVVYGGWSWRTMGQVKVNGPMYERIVQGKDLVADLLPPSLYIVESYLTAHQIPDSQTQAEGDKLIARLEKLRSDFEDGYAKYRKAWNGRDKDTEDALFTRAYPAGKKFYEEAFNDFLPAFRRHDARATEVALRKLGDDFELHRIAIEEAGKALAAHNTEEEQSTASNLSSNLTLLIGILLASVLAGCGVALMITRSVVRRTKLAGDLVADIGRGKFDNVIPMDGGDEVGQMLVQLGKVQESLRQAAAKAADDAGQIDAINRSQAVIEFNIDGTIRHANAIFLTVMGYTLEQIVGKHHSMFVDPLDVAKPDYRQFWDKLGRGEPVVGQFRRLASDGRELWLQGNYSPIADANGKFYKVVKLVNDITAQRKEAELNAAFKGALDNLTANVMAVDNNLNVVYMNNTIKELMSSAQADFRKDLPGFDANKLMGASIDLFHKNPSHQRSMLASMTKATTSQFVIGGRSIRVTANPMTDATGRRLGSVVEWTDRTAEVQAERDVQSMVDAITDGRLENRIPLEGKKGFFEALSKGINSLVDNVSDVVTEVQKLVDKANAGDLRSHIELEGKSGLMVKIGAGINQLTDNMGEIVSRVKLASNEVGRGADEISQGNANLSQRTEEQASSLEETASSMEEMTSTVKQNADNAGQANQLAVAARDQADKGGAVVAKAVKAMTEINDSSKKIADIIGVIDEIAFQTNLLALNAAVEAARAGEQGRGFAVVASEVRNLAGRSATAAKEIKELIQDSVKKVDEGSSLVAQSGQTLDQIVSAVKKVSDIIAEIAAASQEQSSGIDQVNKAVMQLDEMTQQNAALVEEASAASQSMADQARQLNDMLSRYQVSQAALDSAARSVTASGGTSATTSTHAAPAHAVAAVAAKVERRSGNRPWSKGAAAAAPAKSAAAPAAATGTDAEWKEF